MLITLHKLKEDALFKKVLAVMRLWAGSPLGCH